MQNDGGESKYIRSVQTTAFNLQTAAVPLLTDL